MATSVAAWAKIEWLEKEYNFGTFKEADGPVTGSVRFVNKGPETTFISRVRPSCGCTAASYPHEMIEPGDTAEVTFTYNPVGRPGRFDKAVRVYIGADNELTSVRIKGTVIGDSSTLESVFPIQSGSIRLDYAKILAGEIKRGEARNLFVNVYNQGSDSIRPTWSDVAPSLKVDLTPTTIPPGEIATFSFYLDTTKEKNNGPLEYNVKISDGLGSEQAVEVKAIIVPDTRTMSVDEIDNGPRAYLLPEFIDFGDVENQGLIDFEFNILNDGNSKMKVDRVYSTNELVSITDCPKKIKKGKKGTVKGKLNVAGLQPGPFRIRVEVITNDALHPIRTANLVGLKK